MCKFAKVLTLVGLLSVVLNAPVHAAKPGPCHKILMRCQKAGFFRKGHSKGKGLFHDCLQKITAGQTVKGVSASADEISACKKHADAREGKNN